MLPEINMPMNNPHINIWENNKSLSDLEEIFFDKKSICNESFLESTQNNSNFKEIQSTKYSNSDNSKDSNSIENVQPVYDCLKNNEKVNFNYLISEKTFDPKHLPIEDKGTIYYYQDDPILYKKIKKYIIIFK